ncbi:2,4'-dihydroxyacetophenone dioxygenase family protein [Tumebacillus sp. ITR2]|uniref:2,4'-dihydroxyacetophenone dioxygenase family protein n=1 Tax=Tumebacillus amylolyticus TaxID=2801339 RepID=A0ABS1J8B1_9BACL|nr:2,4'-dihydroxyacetophenone dioxygenase family protein [Tumebacillus amylolyticus]MBL0386501.1 2,4'-dihydroxyacetophenone dioxygenase family protein [Tumebacillus amylolyticus]
MNTQSLVNKKVKGREAHAFDTSYIDPETLPWVPWVNGCFLKVLKVNPISGQFMVMLKTPPQLDLPGHHHYGIVLVHTIQGRWRYEGKEWLAKPGDIVFEPAGSFHKPITAPDNTDELILFNYLEGSLNFVDDDGNALFTLDWVAAADMYYNYCKEHNIEPVDLGAY